MKQLIKNVKRLALALCLATPIVSWADFAMTNPVTGEMENYTWKFVGTDTWNGTGYWQDSSGANPDKVPARTYTEAEGGNSRWDLFSLTGTLYASMPACRLRVGT